MHISSTIIIEFLWKVEANRLFVIDISDFEIINALKSFSGFWIFWTWLYLLFNCGFSRTAIDLWKDLAFHLDLLSAHCKQRGVGSLVNWGIIRVLSKILSTLIHMCFRWLKSFSNRGFDGGEILHVIIKLIIYDLASSKVSITAYESTGRGPRIRRHLFYF